MSSKARKSLDDKFQCMIHEMSNDRDWINFKKSLVRAPQIIKQTINIGSQMPKHKEFEELYLRFVKAEENIHSLVLEITKYHGYTETFLKEFLGFTNAFTEVVTQSLDSNSLEECSASSIRDSSRPEGNINLAVRLSEELQEILEQTKPNLELLMNNVRDPVKRITSITKEIKRNIRERDFAILDVNKYENNLVSLKERTASSNGVLTLKQEENLVRYEKNLELSKLKYNLINDLFLKEFPKFFKIVSDLMRPLCVTLYYIQLTIYYTLTKIGDIPEHLFTPRTKEKEMKSTEFFSEVVKKFRKNHSVVKEIADKLTITKSKEEIDLERLHLQRQRTDEEINHPDARSEAASSIRTDYQYCYAKYDFAPQEEGDLALKKGDRIKILSKRSDAEWWKGESNGKVGVFPKNYISL